MLFSLCTINKIWINKKPTNNNYTALNDIITDKFLRVSPLITYVLHEVKVKDGYVRDVRVNLKVHLPLVK